jgi:hypothetical protein
VEGFEEAEIQRPADFAVRNPRLLFLFHHHQCLNFICVWILVRFLLRSFTDRFVREREFGAFLFPVII